MIENIELNIKTNIPKTLQIFWVTLFPLTRKEDITVGMIPNMRLE